MSRLSLLCAKSVLALSVLTVAFNPINSAEAKEKTYKVTNFNNVEVSDELLNRFVSLAADEVEKEKNLNKKNRATSNAMYNYILASSEDDEFTLIYEDNNINDPTVIISKNDKEKANSLNEQLLTTTGEDIPLADIGLNEQLLSTTEEGTPLTDTGLNEQLSPTSEGITPLADSGGFIPDGVGGRVKINGSSASYLSTAVTTALPSQIYIPPAGGTNCPTNPGQAPADAICSAFIYGGYSSGSYEADMGLLYDATIGPSLAEQGYKAFMAVKKGGVLQGQAWNTEYDDVTFKNVYKAGTVINQYYYRNNAGKVRLKVEGLATCSDNACNNPADKTLISIIETTANLNLASVTNWKLVTTVTSLNNTGKNQADYASIKLDGVLVPSSSFQPAEVDRAQVTRDANLKYFFTN